MTAASADRQRRMRVLVDDNLPFVARTLRKAGVHPSELDDQVQRTFMKVVRRFDDVQIGAERSFLHQVALNTALHARRNVARRREVMTDEGPPETVESLVTPEHLMGRKQLRDLLAQLIDRIPRLLRPVFVLYTVEEKTTGEIAALLGLRRGTVMSRLRRARAHLRAQAVAIELAWDCEIACGTPPGDPGDPWREGASPLARALLQAGTAMLPAAGTHARTLEVLGLA